MPTPLCTTLGNETVHPPSHPFFAARSRAVEKYRNKVQKYKNTVEKYRKIQFDEHRLSLNLTSPHTRNELECALNKAPGMRKKYIKDTVKKYKKTVEKYRNELECALNGGEK